jgi:hypothetical protein
MCKAVAGFILGYLAVALLVAPTALWVLHVTPSYASGVVVVLDRTGVLAPTKSTIDQATETRDRLLPQLAGYVSSKLWQGLPEMSVPR